MKLWRAVTTNTSWICVCSVYSGGLSKISYRRFITPKMYSPAFRRLEWRRLNNSSFVVGFKPATTCSLRWYSTPRYGHNSNPCYDSLHRQGNIFLRGFWSCGCTLRLPKRDHHEKKLPNLAKHSKTLDQKCKQEAYFEIGSVLERHTIYGRHMYRKMFTIQSAKASLK